MLSFYVLYTNTESHRWPMLCYEPCKWMQTSPWMLHVMSYIKQTSCKALYRSWILIQSQSSRIWTLSVKHVCYHPIEMDQDWHDLLLVCRPENIRIHVTGNILKLEAPRSSFAKMSVCKVSKWNVMYLFQVLTMFYIIPVSQATFGTSDTRSTGP